MRPLNDSEAVVAVTGSIVVMAVAGVLTAVRTLLGPVNVALLLVGLVVAAAVVGGRVGGAATAVFAALSLNFFHTRPYLSLRIHSGDDIVTVLLLLAVGIAVGELVQRNRREARRGRSGLTRVVRVAELAVREADRRAVIAAVEEELTGEFDLRDIWFQPGPSPNHDHPCLLHNGQIRTTEYRWAGEEFELPDGLTLHVEYRGREAGRFVMATKPGKGISRSQRLLAVAMVDHLAPLIADPIG